MSQETIPVSVIIPNYNSGNFLQECIESINLSQQPAEIIIVDDCSTDNSITLAFKLSSLYSNIRVIKHEVNLGAVEARRTGILIATQNFVALVDADDFLEADALVNAYLRVNVENTDMCIWDMWRFDAGRLWNNIPLNSINFPKTGRDAVIDTLGEWKIHPMGIAKKKLYLSAYCGFSNKNLNADELLTRLVFSAAEKISFCEKKYFYRVNAESSTQKISIKRLTTLDSYIWLIQFAKPYPQIYLEKIGKAGIAQAWYFFRYRKTYGTKLVISNLTHFIIELSKYGDLDKWLWKCPKHLFAFSIIWIVVKLKIGL
jgi:glycosyltransferase involved in cell wall biosynthesis